MWNAHFPEEVWTQDCSICSMIFDHLSSQQGTDACLQDGYIHLFVFEECFSNALRDKFSTAWRKAFKPGDLVFESPESLITDITREHWPYFQTLKWSNFIESSLCWFQTPPSYKTLLLVENGDINWGSQSECLNSSVDEIEAENIFGRNGSWLHLLKLQDSGPIEILGCSQCATKGIFCCTSQTANLFPCSPVDGAARVFPTTSCRGQDSNPRQSQSYTTLRDLWKDALPTELPRQWQMPLR